VACVGELAATEYYRFPTCDLGGSAEDEWAACRLRACVGRGLAGCLHDWARAQSLGVVCLYDVEQQRSACVAFAAYVLKHVLTPSTVPVNELNEKLWDLSTFGTFHLCAPTPSRARCTRMERRLRLRL
jgi:hypothetical protein